MQIITPFDPSAVASGTINTGLVNRCAVIYLINESAIGIKLTFADGSTGVVPPWFARAFQLAVPNSPIQWQQLYTLGSTSAPVSMVQGEGYEPNEVEWAQLAQGPLARQVNIGNTISTTSGSDSATNLTNDGNIMGTQIVESTVSGDGTSAVSLTNSAVLVLGNSTHTGSISSDNALFRTDGSGNVTAHNISATGTLTVSGNTSLVGGLSGSLKGITTFTTSTVSVNANSSAIVTHGLGSTPSIVMAQPTGYTGGGGGHAWAITSITSTQFTIHHTNSFGSNAVFSWIAMK